MALNEVQMTFLTRISGGGEGKSDLCLGITLYFEVL